MPIDTGNGPRMDITTATMQFTKKWFCLQFRHCGASLGQPKRFISINIQKPFEAHRAPGFRTTEAAFASHRRVFCKQACWSERVRGSNCQRMSTLWLRKWYSIALLRPLGHVHVLRTAACHCRTGTSEWIREVKVNQGSKFLGCPGQNIWPHFE
jgi:hypothetical protein